MNLEPRFQNPEGSIGPLAPVVILSGGQEKPNIFNGPRWSGREDSNLRPLPPEDAAPRPIPWDMMGLPLQAFRFVLLPFAIFSAPGFSVNFRPLSICHQHTACCPDEQWRLIEEFPSYAVSSCGCVMRIKDGHSSRAGKKLKQWLQDGYPTVGLSYEGRQRPIHVHRLVCRAFHGKQPSPIHQVAHGDGTRTNNHASNLRWATPAENAADSIAHGTFPLGDRHWSKSKPERLPKGQRNGAYTKPHRIRRGEDNGCSVLTEAAVRAIRNDARPRKIIAAAHGISAVQVGFIQRRQAWRHVLDDDALGQRDMARAAADLCEAGQ